MVIVDCLWDFTSMSREMVLVELWYGCSIQCHYSCDMVIVDCLWDFTSMSREMVLVELWYECSITMSLFL